MGTRQHAAVSASQLSRHLPPPVLEIGKAFEQAGKELYVAGGWTRDSLMGHTNKDIDFTTDASTSEVEEIIKGVPNAHTYPLGEKFGTVGVIYKQGGMEWELEITQYRMDEYEEGSRKPEVTPVKSVYEDLARRDFTINCLAISTDGLHNIVDPFGGANDIEAGIIRCPGNPLDRMNEDPLRMLRAVRFASRLRRKDGKPFRIEASLLNVLKNRASNLEKISWERRRDELDKILELGGERTRYGIDRLTGIGLMKYVVPEVSEMSKSDFQRTLDALERAPQDLRYATLLHRVPPEEVRHIARRMKASSERAERTQFLVSSLRLIEGYKPGMSDGDTKRLIRNLTFSRGTKKPIIPVAKTLEFGSVCGLRTERIKHLEKRARKFKDCIYTESPLDGDEIMAIKGEKGGPWVKVMKNRLLDMVLDGELRQGDKAKARLLVKEWVA